MKLAYILLAHQYPQLVIRLIKRLIASGSSVVLHYDLNGGAEDFQLIQQELATCEDQVLYASRIRVAWGQWSIVQATLNALAQLATLKINPDYVHLMSGMDYPLRSELELKDFLHRNYGNEFIQAVDINSNKWVKDGLSSERFEYRHYFNWQQHKKLFDVSFKIQRALKFKRKFPQGFTPYMGSQWWTLTWSTCEAILERSQDVELVNFFKTVWIPDEMYIQTLVATIVAKSKIFGKCLTLYQFNHNGMPLVFTNGHHPYLTRQPFFFARKISAYAPALRDELDRYHAGQLRPRSLPDEDVGIYTKEYEYFLKRNENLNQPGHRIIGLIHDAWYGDLEWNDKSYYVIVGGSKLELKIVQNFLNQQSNIMCHGDLFAAEQIDFFGEVDEYAGFKAEDTALRDHSRPNFLVEVIRKAKDKIVAFLLPFGEGGDLLDICLWDKNARIIALKTNPFLLYRDHEKEINSLTMWAVDSEDHDGISSHALYRGELQSATFFDLYQTFRQQHDRFWSNLHTAYSKHVEILIYDHGKSWTNELLTFIDSMEMATKEQQTNVVFEIARKNISTSHSLAKRINKQEYANWLASSGVQEINFATNSKPYYVIIGWSLSELKIVQDFLNQQPGIICHGDLFAATHLDFVGKSQTYAGFQSEDTVLRDYNRQNCLAQILRQDIDKVVAFLLPFGTGGNLLYDCLWDSNSRIILLKTNPFLFYRDHEEEINVAAMWTINANDNIRLKNYSIYFCGLQSSAFFEAYKKFSQQYQDLLGYLHPLPDVEAMFHLHNIEIRLYDNGKVWMNELLSFIDNTEIATEKEKFVCLEKLSWHHPQNKLWVTKSISQKAYNHWLNTYQELYGDPTELVTIFSSLKLSEQDALAEYIFPSRNRNFMKDALLGCRASATDLSPAP